MSLRLGMWSGPRNISTAMMRAFENRPDCVVVDEPFYACYLQATGVVHPMNDAVIASQSSDWSKVARALSEGPFDASLFYQKLMTHHMLPGVDLAWARQLSHCFLARNPYEVVSSYRQKRESVTTGDIGVIRQLALYEELCDITGQRIPVIDARAVLENPRAVLSTVCDHLGLEFYEDMLSWPAGARDSDGVWAPHWYEAVEKSTGFQPYRDKPLQLSASDRQVAAESMPAYESLLRQGRLA